MRIHQLTVKDFIEYGGPCLECGSNLVLSLRFIQDFQSSISFFPVAIEKDKITISLLITPTDALIMHIDPKTNKFWVTGPRVAFESYMKGIYSYPDTVDAGPIIKLIILSSI